MSGHLTFDYHGETYWLDHLGAYNPEDYGAFAVMCDDEEIGEIWTYAYGCSPLVARVPLPTVDQMLKLALDVIDSN